MGIDREDKEARIKHYLNMYRFFGAPAVVYLVIDGRLNVPYSCLDVGSIGTTLCYAAAQEGLGTIYLAAGDAFPDLVKKALSIPEDKKIVIGIAIGYPHPDAPASLFRSDREPVENIRVCLNRSAIVYNRRQKSPLTTQSLTCLLAPPFRKGGRGVI